jgi:phosphatidylserine decarboxylase
MEHLLISIITNTILSTALFWYLVRKVKIHRRFLYTDNILIIVFATALGFGLSSLFAIRTHAGIVLLNVSVVLALIICCTLIHFYRDPERQPHASDADVLSPADGFVIYIKKLKPKELPFSIKGSTISKLSELTKTDLLETPCWLIGITMTLFDVHVIRAPVEGKVILNEYVKGRFLSLKKGASETENERRTTVFSNHSGRIGVVQIASKRVRGIRNFIKQGEYAKFGQRIGAIRFGSQTDVILPINATLNVRIGQWVYGGKSVIATLHNG